MSKLILAINCVCVSFIFVMASEYVLGEEKTSIQPQLVGQWKSDLEETMEFNTQHAKLELGQIAAMNQLFGNLTIEFAEDTFTMYSGAQSIKKNGKTIELDESTEHYQYKVIGKTADAIAIASKQVGCEECDEELEIWRFVDDDHAWIYVGDSLFESHHLREYFTRVK